MVCLLGVWSVQRHLAHQRADVKVFQHLCFPSAAAVDQSPSEPVMQIRHVLHRWYQLLNAAAALQSHVGIDIRRVANIAEELAQGAEAHLVGRAAPRCEALRRAAAYARQKGQIVCQSTYQVIALVTRNVLLLLLLRFARNKHASHHPGMEPALPCCPAASGFFNFCKFCADWRRHHGC